MYHNWMFGNTYYYNGDTYNVSVIIYDSDGSSISVEVNWKSSESPTNGLIVRRAPILAIIKHYSKENIALNLYFLIKNIIDLPFINWNFSTQIEYYCNNVPEFLPYRDEVVKYYNRYNKQKAFW